MSTKQNKKKDTEMPKPEDMNGAAEAMQTETALAPPPKDSLGGGKRELAIAGRVGPVMQTEDLSEYDEFLGEGHENRRASDNLIPMIYVLQDNSKVVKNRERPVKANPGDFYNTATDQTYDGRKGLTIVPVNDEVRYVEWVPVDDGGGFVAEYAPDDERIADIVAMHKFKKIEFPKGVSGTHPKRTELIETRMLYALIVHADRAWEPVVFPLTSIKLGGWKKWFNKVFPQTDSSGKLPQYSQLAKISTFADHDHKKASNVPENIKLETVSVETDDVGVGAKESRLRSADTRFQAGKKFYDAITKEGAKIDRESAKKVDGDEELPF